VRRSSRARDEDECAAARPSNLNLEEDTIDESTADFAKPKNGSRASHNRQHTICVRRSFNLMGFTSESGGIARRHFQGAAAALGARRLNMPVPPVDATPNPSAEGAPTPDYRRISTVALAFIKSSIENG